MRNWINLQAKINDFQFCRKTWLYPLSHCYHENWSKPWHFVERFHTEEGLCWWLSSDKPEASIAIPLMTFSWLIGNNWKRNSRVYSAPMESSHHPPPTPWGGGQTHHFPLNPSIRRGGTLVNNYWSTRGAKIPLDLAQPNRFHILPIDRYKHIYMYILKKWGRNAGGVCMSETTMNLWSVRCK